MRFRGFVFGVWMLWLLGITTAMAQVAPSLNGRVTDASGGGLANVTVELTQVATGLKQSAVSSRAGDYVFMNLIPGQYKLEAVAPGFSRLVREGVTAVTGTTATVDLALTVGSASQTVSVTADAPLLQAATSNIQTSISASNVAAMPLNTRNYIQLATQSVGVALPPGQLLPRINGGRPRTNEYLLDGISLLQPEPGQVAFFPNLDAMQEFTVETNNVPAEFGRFNGGVVNASTKSGSSSFHGSVFEYLRNKSLNARSYFATTGDKPHYNRNLFGATFGGPVLPGRLFFFVDYQGSRQSIGITRTSTVPTAAMRKGNFSSLLSGTTPSQLYYPGTTTKVAGNDFSSNFSTLVDPVAVAILNAYIPAATSTASSNNYKRVANDVDHQNQFDIRLDGVLGTNDRVYGRYTFYREVEDPSTPLPLYGGALSGSVYGTGNVIGLSDVTGQQAMLNETHTFSARLLNEVRLGYTRRGNMIDSYKLGNTVTSALGIPNVLTNTVFNNAMPTFTFAGNGAFQQVGPSAGAYSQYQTGVWQLMDSVLYRRGRHSLKVGMDFRWYQLNALSPNYPGGLFAFNNTGTNISTDSYSGNSFASFLLGQVDNYQIDLQPAANKMRERDHIEEFFAQDDWKLSSKLTVNLGARWTLHFPSVEKDNQGAVFNLSSKQLDYMGVNGNSRSARDLHYANVAPRVGLAYLLTPKTVVRSGYGIVFIDQSGITTPFTVPQYPFIQNLAQKTADNVKPAFKLSSGPTVKEVSRSSADAGLGQSVYTVKRTAGSGYSQQWNLAIQREITPNLSVEIAYVGSRIVHLGMPDTNLNQIDYATLQRGGLPTTDSNYLNLKAKVSNPCTNNPTWSSIGSTTQITRAQSLKSYNCFLNVSTYRQNTGQSNYHGGQVKVTKRFSRGNSLMFGYTRSKLIDDASSVFSTTVLSSPNSSSLSGADVNQPGLERDLSTGDMPNVLSASGVYALPLGRGHRYAQGGLANVLLGGWTVNALVQSQSGMPVQVTQSTNNNSFAGYAIQRPNQSGNAELSSDQRSVSQWFNTSKFSSAAIYTLGGARRNPVRGPAYRNLDFALIKNTKIWNEAGMEFRAEIFDLTNTPGLAQPGGSLVTTGSSSFGKISSTVTDPRVVQFAIRLYR